jgi:hypothetical protein
MYGERDDPIAVMTRLGRQLEATTNPDALLPAVTASAGAAPALCGHCHIRVVEVSAVHRYGNVTPVEPAMFT